MDSALLPEIINEDKVEEVRKHRKQGHSTQLLVHQKGYENEHDQWIAKTELPHAKEAIEDYWSRILSQNL